MLIILLLVMVFEYKEALIIYIAYFIFYNK